MASFTLEINFEINFEIYVNLFLSKEIISSVNSQLSKEINFESVFRNLEHVLFCEILPKKFRLWSALIGHSVANCHILFTLLTSSCKLGLLVEAQHKDYLKMTPCLPHILFSISFQLQQCTISKSTPAYKDNIINKLFEDSWIMCAIHHIAMSHLCTQHYYHQHFYKQLH